MAAVAPPQVPAAAPAPAAAAAAAAAPAPAPAAAAAAAPVADQTTDLLQKLSLDAQPKAVDAATEPAGAKKGPAASQPLSVAIPPERSITPVLQDFMDPNMFYLPAYYYGGYDGSVSEWDDYPRYVNPDGVEITPAVYGDIYGYGYAPYGAYSPASSPVPTVDGQMFGQHYQYPTSYYQPPTPVPSTTQGDLQPSANPDKPTTKADPAKTTTNSAPNGAHFAWYDGSAYTNGQQRTTTTNHMSSSTFSNGSSARTQNKGSTPQQMGMNNRRPTTTTGSAAPTYPNRTRSYSQYGNSYKTGLSYSTNGYGSNGYGSNGYDSRLYGRWGLSMDNRYKPRGRGNGYYGFGNESQDGTIELNRGPRSGRFKNQKLFGHTVTIAVKGQSLPSSDSKNATDVPDRTQFNRDDFPVQYDDAKFFVIKSYSEDDIHKSIKYNVWASTTNGNKKLDAAYQEAQAKSSKCPIFLFFSVNTSGQFVGVAEMTGAVDFEKTLEYWQQDKWNGSLSLKWHIVKDVPNNILKHIILENNENKPVTNSRDTQEVNLDQGIQMLKIFKEHVSKTSILDDFAFYENRQKLMQEKRVKQQQIQKQVWDSRAPNSVTGEKQQDAATAKPKLPNGVNGELKVPAENGTAPAVTYAAKVAQTAATEKPALANGTVKAS
uniref:YTH domain-containing family protein n=1 Tax=Oryza meridionalis TaxID=40149 RepID=A0A0E0CVF0_9ORYZ